VAAGTGAASFVLAELGARVIATDFAERMVEVLKRRAEERGLETVEARIMDGQALDLPDESLFWCCAELASDEVMSRPR
jgi:ubiquinone/menaquinone biosynthesis C-methylase UbiE